MPGRPTHLVRRFFDVLGSRPLSGEERQKVESWTGPELAAPFFEQGDPDQRHGYEAGRFVASHSVQRPDLVMAAVLHDVGKRHARLGVMGRTITSLFILLRLPLTANMRSYRDHGEIGASELARLGAPGPVVEYIRHHHGTQPPGFPAEDWELLQRADQPPKARKWDDPPITSQD